MKNAGFGACVLTQRRLVLSFRRYSPIYGAKSFQATLKPNYKTIQNVVCVVMYGYKTASRFLPSLI